MDEKRFIPKTLAVACAAAMLGACGGGSGGDQAQNQPSSSTPVISGKAIDGYLVNAQACLDMNRNNACDADEPSATTDAEGGFAVAYDGDAIGQRLLVQVAQSTKDVSRPVGFQFPAGFTLSSIVDGSTNQHVTPLTTMIVAQMEAGMSYAQAVAAVRELLGDGVDPRADYVANGDVGTQGKAAQIIDKVTSFGLDGSVGADGMRNVLNAIIQKGDIAAVTQADVDAQGSKPVYKPVDAAALLAQPLYGFVEYLSRSVTQIVGNELRIDYQGHNDDGTVTWEPYPDGRRVTGMEPPVQFVMRPDGTWSQMLTPKDWRAPIPLSTVGHVLKGADPMTGIALTFEERRVDLSMQPASLAMSGLLFGPNESAQRALHDIYFPAGTTGYSGVQTFEQDYVVLPLGFGGGMGCPFPYVKEGSCPTYLASHSYGLVDRLPSYFDSSKYLSLPPYGFDLPSYDPAQVFNDPALPSPLVSAQQLVGLTIVESMMLSYGARNMEIDIMPDGKARIVNPTANQPPMPSTQGAQISEQLSADGVLQNSFAGEPVDVTWQIHPRYPEVMVFDISSDALAILGKGLPARRTHQPMLRGGKFLLAVRNGQLQSGLMLPAGYGHPSLRFAEKIPDVVSWMFRRSH